jgi:hypothetical protein
MFLEEPVVHRLAAIGTDAMAEFSVGSLTNVGLDLDPLAPVIPDLLAG